MALTQTKVSQLYVAIFNRASEGTGNTYWQSAHTDATTTANAMFALPIVSTYFGVTNFTDTANIRTVIEAIYLNALGKAPADDVAGITYWIGEVTGGRSIGDVVSSLVTSATATANAGAAQNIFNNKVTVSNYAAATLSAHTTDAAFQAYIASVTAATSSVTAANALILAAVPVVSNPGSTFTLTTAGDNITGTANDDQINGLAGITASAATDTLTAVDIIDGGDGNDTMMISAAVGNHNTDVLSSSLVSNVENLQIRSVTAAHLATLDASDATGLTGTISSHLSAGNFTVTNMLAGTKALITGNGTLTNGASNFGMVVAAATAQELTVTSSVGAGAIVLTGAGVLSTVVNTTGATNVMGAITAAVTSTSLVVNSALAATGLITSAGATAVTINSAGKTTIADLQTSSAAASLTITGVGATKLTAALDTGFTTVVAGTATGNLTLAASSLVTAVTTLGSGNDIYTTGAVLTTGSVAGGTGTDVLVIGANVGHANTATLAAKYTGFETLSVAGVYAMSLMTSLTALQVTAASTVTAMTATQAANVNLTVDMAGVTLALADATGTSDALSVSFGTGLTTGEASDMTAALTVTGFEILNLSSNAGPTATDLITTFANAFIGATLNDINMTGGSYTLADAATIVAVDIDATALTGSTSVASTAIGLTITAGAMVAGSVVNGSAHIDKYTLGAEGTTYKGNAGKDLFTTAFGFLAADGTTDSTLSGGDGIDTLSISDTTVTMTDNHFTNVTGMEKLTFTNTVGDMSLTSGAAFNTAFAAGSTIVTGEIAAIKDATIAMGLSTTDLTITVGIVASTGAATSTNSVVTGSGADTVSIVGGANFVGVVGAAQGTIVANTGGGNDTINITVGNLVTGSNGVGRAITVDAGTGKDIITLTGKANGLLASAFGNAIFVVEDGDSTVTNYDEITGFLAATAADISDTLEFGTSVVGTLATSIDSGTILSHIIAGGVARFDDAAVHAADLIINSTNLADVVGYLAANSQNTGAIAFAYDNTGNGTADSTMMYHNDVTDSLVLLKGLTGVDLLSTALTSTAGDIFVQ